MTLTTPGYLSAYQDGLDARNLGKPLDNNPHAYWSVERAYWLLGWSERDEDINTLCGMPRSAPSAEFEAISLIAEAQPTTH